MHRGPSFTTNLVLVLFAIITGAAFFALSPVWWLPVSYVIVTAFFIYRFNAL